jgi:hypothetical protein
MRYLAAAGLCVLFLVLAPFCAYGCFRGVMMFLTLDPLSILAGLVLFAVSAAAGMFIFGRTIVWIIRVMGSK